MVYLPSDVISALKLREDDEISFLKADARSYVIAKSSDVAKMMLGQYRQDADQQSGPEASRQQTTQQPAQLSAPSQEEISVLRKIDMIRYENRTQENTMKILDEQEKRVFQRLIANGTVKKFKGKEGKDLYSISKMIYDRFVMRKPQAAGAQERAASQPRVQPAVKSAAGPEDQDISELQKNGYLVLQTEAEASRVSLLLEQSIRHGQVLGTRSFNKNREFYILLRSYFDMHAQGMLRKLREKGYRVQDLAKELGISEEGARGVLYLLAESGDVMEKKKELFVIA